MDSGLKRRIENVVDRIIPTKNHQECCICSISFTEPVQSSKRPRTDQEPLRFPSIWTTHGSLNTCFNCMREHLMRSGNKCLCNSPNHKIIPENIWRKMTNLNDTTIQWFFEKRKETDKVSTEPDLTYCPFKLKYLPYFCKTIFDRTFQQFLHYLIRVLKNQTILTRFVILDKNNIKSICLDLIHTKHFDVVHHLIYNHYDHVPENIFKLLLSDKNYDLEIHYKSFTKLIQRLPPDYSKLFPLLSKKKHPAIQICLEDKGFNPDHTDRFCVDCPNHNLCREHLFTSLQDDNYPVFRQILLKTNALFDFKQLFVKNEMKLHNRYGELLLQSNQFIKALEDENTFYSIYWHTKDVLYNINQHIANDTRFSIERANLYEEQYICDLINNGNVLPDSFKPTEKITECALLNMKAELIEKSPEKFICKPTNKILLQTILVVEHTRKLLIQQFLGNNIDLVIEEAIRTKKSHYAYKFACDFDCSDELYHKLYYDVMINYNDPRDRHSNKITEEVANRVIFHCIKHNMPIPQHISRKFDIKKALYMLVDENSFNCVAYFRSVYYFSYRYPDHPDMSEVLILACKKCTISEMFEILIPRSTNLDQAFQVAIDHNNETAIKFAIEHNIGKKVRGIIDDQIFKINPDVEKVLLEKGMIDSYLRLKQMYYN